MRPDARWRAAGRLAIFPLGARQVGAQVEQIVLDVAEDVLDTLVLDVQKSDADDIEGAKGSHADMEFWQACSVAKRRAPVVTGAGVESIDSHGKSSGAVEWTARFRRGNAPERSKL
jgi:hypothetical protein